MGLYPNAQQLILTVDNVSWTPVTCPIPCNFISLFNYSTSNIRRRFVSSNPATERIIYSGMVDGPDQGMPQPRFDIRYVENQVVYYLQAVTGTVEVTIEFRN